MSSSLSFTFIYETYVIIHFHNEFCSIISISENNIILRDILVKKDEYVRVWQIPYLKDRIKLTEEINRQIDKIKKLKAFA